MSHITARRQSILETITIRYGDMVSDHVRWALFIYATKIKGIKYRELGITSATGNMIKNGKRRVSDDLLERILEKLSAKDLIQVTLLLKQWSNGEAPEWARRLAWLGRRPDEAEQFFNLLYELMSENYDFHGEDPVIVFSPESLERFAAWMKAQDKKPRTIKERLHSLRRLISALGWKPSVYDIIDYMSRQSENARDHIRKAVRLYLHFIGRKELLELFKAGWKHYEEEEIEPAIGIDEFYDILVVAKNINKNYAIYLAGLLITGLRPVELRSLEWRDQTVIDPRIFRLRVTSRRKRAYYAFLTPGLLGILENTMIESSQKLFHYRRENEYKVLKAIRKLKPGFRPYDLRSLNTYLLYSARIDKDTIRFMHGWISRKTWWKFYLSRHVTKKQALLETLRMHNTVFHEIDQRITKILG